MLGWCVKKKKVHKQGRNDIDVKVNMQNVSSIPASFHNTGKMRRQYLHLYTSSLPSDKYAMPPFPALFCTTNM